MQERRAHGLYFNCDEKFLLGHWCKQMFMMVTMEPVEKEVEEFVVEEAPIDQPREERVKISINAIYGITSP